MYVYHRRAMSGYVVRQTPKKVSSQKTAGFAEKLVWHVWKKTTNAERQAQLNTNHWIHSQRSAHLFIKALGQSLRFVRWRPGVSGMSSPVRGLKQWNGRVQKISWVGKEKRVGNFCFLNKMFWGHPTLPHLDRKNCTDHKLEQLEMLPNQVCAMKIPCSCFDSRMC